MSRGLGVTQLAMLQKLSIYPDDWSTIRQLDLTSAHSADDLRSKNAALRRAARSLEGRGLVEIHGPGGKPVPGLDGAISGDVDPIGVRITDRGMLYLYDRDLVTQHDVDYRRVLSGIPKA